jgi:PhzF family phenazine biosynthesis protein
VLGAAAAAHERTAPGRARVEWQFAFPDRQLPVVSQSDPAYFTADMDQGRAVLSSPLPDETRREIGPLLGIQPHNLRDLPIQVVSTGLPYLIVPVTPDGLTRARVAHGLEAWLSRLGAKFVYLLDTDAREGRTWDNAGDVEDIATGSAAGPAAAYLLQHQLTSDDGPIRLSQGRFLGRPSTITVTRDHQHHLWVGGPVRPVASGTLESLPPSGSDEAS